MKTLLRKFQDMMAAVAYAEAGEFDTAREIMMESEREATPRKRTHDTVSPDAQPQA